jgi:hypothetical protein
VASCHYRRIPASAPAANQLREPEPPKDRTPRADDRSNALRAPSGTQGASVSAPSHRAGSPPVVIGHTARLPRGLIRA